MGIQKAHVQNFTQNQPKIKIDFFWNSQQITERLLQRYTLNMECRQ